MVFPEGVRGMNKTFGERYKLQRFGTGFVRLALETGTPDRAGRHRRLGGAAARPREPRGLGRALGMPAFPITPTFPWLGPLGLLPLPVRYHIHFGEPLRFEGDAGDEDAVIEAKVEEVKAAIAGLLARGARGAPQRLLLMRRCALAALGAAVLLAACARAAPPRSARAAAAGDASASGSRPSAGPRAAGPPRVRLDRRARARALRCERDGGRAVGPAAHPDDRAPRGARRRRRARRGDRAPPSATRAHATLVTGRPPREHGVVADQRLGERGVRQRALLPREPAARPTLWQLAAERARAGGGARLADDDGRGRRCAAARRRARRGAGERCGERSRARATPALAARCARPGRGRRGRASRAPRETSCSSSSPASSCRSAPARAAAPPPHADRGRAARGRAGDAAARAAFAGADAEVARLLACVDDAGLLADAAIAVVGDRTFEPVHTRGPPERAPRAGAAALARRVGRRRELVGPHALERRLRVRLRERRGARGRGARRARGRRARRPGAFRVVPATRCSASAPTPRPGSGSTRSRASASPTPRLRPILVPSPARAASRPAAPKTAPRRPASSRSAAASAAACACREMSQLDVAPTLASRSGSPSRGPRAGRSWACSPRRLRRSRRSGRRVPGRRAELDSDGARAPATRGTAGRWGGAETDERPRRDRAQPGGAATLRARAVRARRGAKAGGRASATWRCWCRTSACCCSGCCATSGSRSATRPSRSRASPTCSRRSTSCRRCSSARSASSTTSSS